MNCEFYILNYTHYLHFTRGIVTDDSIILIYYLLHISLTIIIFYNLFAVGDASFIRLKLMFNGLENLSHHKV